MGKAAREAWLAARRGPLFRCPRIPQPSRFPGIGTPRAVCPAAVAGDREMPGVGIFVKAKIGGPAEGARDGRIAMDGQLAPFALPISHAQVRSSPPEARIRQAVPARASPSSTLV